MRLPSSLALLVLASCSSDAGAGAAKSCTPTDGGAWSCPGLGDEPACPAGLAQGGACNVQRIDTTNPGASAGAVSSCLACVNGFGAAWTCNPSDGWQSAGTYSCSAAASVDAGTPAEAGGARCNAACKDACKSQPACVAACGC